MVEEQGASRRSYLRSVGLTTTALTVSGCLGSQSETVTETANTGGNEALRQELGLSEPAEDMGSELRVLNWSEYWHQNTIQDFEAAFDISVTVENYDSNERLYELLSDDPTYDVAFPSDWMVELLIREGALQPIELDRLSNWENLDSRWIEDAPYDIGEQRYSVPYLWGTTGIAWNEQMVDGSLGNLDHLDSWEAMWDSRYRGMAQMLDLPRELFAVALKRLGYSLNTTDPSKIEEAGELLLEQRDRLDLTSDRYTSTEVSDSLINQRATPVHAFSGRAIIARTRLGVEGDSPIAYRIPREGGVVWIDAMVIPREASNPAAARMFIDYMQTPFVAAMNANHSFYASPNEAAQQELPETVLDDPAIYPDAEMMDKLEFIKDVGEARSTYEQEWQRVTDWDKQTSVSMH